ncbi:HAD family hydrolase [Dyadobacter sp. CY345]|uniref:D-glycero-alpha-D-manno-heptose-1,7-bisphosphate 7-phosphatase n=1 Tax=Dyadobacter sp. CY345 TaxID=2909335 RepID=UPI001F41C4C6|nr:HAD family hydrolase [Dyadobacter sp. CY345]MCF2446701.1 HAD family hydrolase [Dyadobacter sp. CY345]
MSYPEKSRQKAVFLDKDGTLIKDVPYNVDPKLVLFEPGVFDGLRKFRDHGFKIIIISNQPGISLGYFTKKELAELICYFEKRFNENGMLLAGFYYCPHLPETSDKSCKCRKPKPELFYTAARDLDIDLNASWIIGDILNDVEAGNRAGCRTVLIDNGNETEWVNGIHRTPDFTAKNFSEAANFITSQTILSYA